MLMTHRRTACHRPAISLAALLLLVAIAGAAFAAQPAAAPTRPVIGSDEPADADSDGVLDAMDNCPFVSNPFQHDMDADGAGDLCDNCPTIANVDQADSNNNGIGDACETVPTQALSWSLIKATYR
jgi:ferredoxin